MTNSLVSRLEKYTLRCSQEVLMIHAEIEGESDQIVIYKGFSSSLMHATAFDPDIPVLPDKAKIISIDRLKSPYDPEQPRYIQQGLAWEEMEILLAQ